MSLPFFRPVVLAPASPTNVGPRDHSRPSDSEKLKHKGYSSLAVDTRTYTYPHHRIGQIKTIPYNLLLNYELPTSNKTDTTVVKLSTCNYTSTPKHKEKIKNAYPHADSHYRQCGPLADAPSWNARSPGNPSVDHFASDPG